MKVVKEGTEEPLDESGTAKVWLVGAAGDKGCLDMREIGKRNDDLIGVLGGVGNCTGSLGVATTARVRSATYSMRSSFTGALSRPKRTTSCR